jgi:hypothetical protein
MLWVLLSMSPCHALHWYPYSRQVRPHVPGRAWRGSDILSHTTCGPDSTSMLHPTTSATSGVTRLLHFCVLTPSHRSITLSPSLVTPEAHIRWSLVALSGSPSLWNARTSLSSLHHHCLSSCPLNATRPLIPTNIALWKKSMRPCRPTTVGTWCPTTLAPML